MSNADEAKVIVARLRADATCDLQFGEICGRDEMFKDILRKVREALARLDKLLAE